MNSSRWNKIASKSRDSSIYHLREWGKILEEVHGHEIYFLENKNTIFPLGLVRSAIFGNRLISMPFADYGGPVTIDKGSVGEILEEVEEVAGELKPDFVEIRAPAKEYFDLLTSKGYERRVDYCTFLLSLEADEEELWKGLEKRTRNGITRSKKEGLSAKRAESHEDLLDFYFIYLKTMKNLGSPPQPFKFFKGLWDEFAKKDSMRIYFANFDSRPIAAMMFFTYGNKIHYSYSCSLYEFRTKRANDFLLWHAISTFSSEGFERFDFGRTRFNSGVYKYKRGWGGREVEMPYFYKFLRKRLEERQETKYKTISEFWSRYMPESLARRIGPWIIRQIG